MKRSMFALLILCLSPFYAQSTANSSSEIYHDLLRLQKNASVMYLAAHPDDENTKIISWLTNDQHLDAVYLSLTRGDGGQNLIGNEIGDMLGLLRTQELLEARKVDKGRQWFTRALDFGYSKTATETLKIWDKQKVLADVVWAIRKNKPELIITRFSPDSNGDTHGHHTASAILAMEAFDLAADKNAFPEQLKYVSTWQVKRMFFNTSWWFYGSQEKFEQADKTGMLSVDVGTYFPLLGKSNNEISAISRSKHACQGFGMATERGSQIEWLKLLKGTMPTNNDMFQGIDLGWENKKIQSKIDKIIKNYDFKAPEKSTKELVALYNLALKEKVDEIKLNQIKNLLLDINGIHMEWTIPAAFGTNGELVQTHLEVSNRGNKKLIFKTKNEENSVAVNEAFKSKFDFKLQQDKFDTPYWLVNKTNNALYNIDQLTDIGQAEILNPVTYPITLNIAGQDFNFELPLQQKYVDPAIGEIYEPFYVVPAFVANFAQENFIFNDAEKTIELAVTSFVEGQKVKIQLETNNDWKVSPAQTYTTGPIGETRKFRFNVQPKENAETAVLSAVVKSGTKTYRQSLDIVNYDHIKRQIRLRDASTRLGNLDFKQPNVKLAYIQGSGDEIPANLREVGLAVDELDINLWNHASLENYDVVMIGIRAFNTLDKLSFIKNDLFDFVEKGGVVIVQYNTNRGLVTEEIAPYPLKLGRDRISEEDAELKILEPKHSIFNYPNKITQRDFANWVQERGLYFADSWDKQFTPLLEGNDTGEEPKQGMLLVAEHGKGHFVYTGISFFRQLPAGVPGAYRLLINMLALGEN
ncbi:PIG-L family deacetylase [Weeksellaceae bacterium KMM 9713]|uniref:PIG-L family deacetylase n=1 Tax=Profundicola chukchiensis TaxID=2961959 RepID=A0A9X4MWD7_9FLAO|nr:PIG-L family deacetylase [Profundicola chukchiensis]MDG4946101.1 PIG-L family deacetylase [Profundicola chukchiensis]